MYLDYLADHLKGQSEGKTSYLVQPTLKTGNVPRRH